MYKNSVEKYYYNDAGALFDKISTISELQYLSLVLSDNKSTNNLAELPLLMTTESFNNLVEYYGGKTIKVPSKTDVYDDLLGVMCYYYYHIRGESWKNTLRLAGVAPTRDGKRIASNRYDAVKSKIESVRVPELSSNIKLLNTEFTSKQSTINPDMLLVNGVVVSKSVYNAVVDEVLKELTDRGTITDKDKKKSEEVLHAD